MVKDFYPCNRKVIEKLLEENNYFGKKENTWRNIIHMKYCSFTTKKGNICCTKIKDEGQIYCKHHRPKSDFILCSYINCKNKCKTYGDYCHKHKKYDYNNINLIEDNIFNYDIFNNYNTVNEWLRYKRWYTVGRKCSLINNRIFIKDYIKDSKYNIDYNEKSYTVIKYFDYSKYMNNLLINIYNELYNYCVKKEINKHYLFCLLNLFYNFYQSSYFRKFHKNNIYIPYINNLSKIIIKDKYIYFHVNKNIKLICHPSNVDSRKLKLVCKNNNDITQSVNVISKKDKNKKMKNKSKNKTVDQLYNIFNDKIKNFISHGKFTKKEIKYVKTVINDTLNKYRIKYENNINLYIYNSSIYIYDEIERYIEKEIYHDIDFFNKLMRNVFINYRIFTLLVNDNSTAEEIENWRSKLENYIFNTLKHF